MAAVNGAPAAPFSYAQAAKGKSPAIKALDQKPEPAPESLTPKATTADDHSNQAENSNAVVEAQQDISLSAPLIGHDLGERSNTQPVIQDDTTGVQTGAPPAESRSSSTRKDDARSPSASAPSELSWRRRPQQDTESISGSASDAGSQKGDRKEKSKDRSHFVEAPAPVVNIWAKRASDQKVKPAATNPTAVVDKPKGTSADAAVNKPTTGTAANASRSEATKDRRSDDRNSRTARSSEPTINRARVPSMDDAGLWPTPETSKDDERRKSQPLTKAEGAQPPPDPAKPHGKNDWKKINFTPTVKFETPVPALGSRGRGRGGSRGGGGGRGGYPPPGGRGSGPGANADESSTGPAKTEQPASSVKPAYGGPRKSRDDSSKSGTATGPKSAPEENAQAPPPDTSRVSPRPGVAQVDVAAVDAAPRRKASKPVGLETASFAPTEAAGAEPKRAHSLNGFPPKPFLSDRRHEKASENGPPASRGEGRPERGGRGGKRGGFFSGNGGIAHQSFQSNGGPPTFFSPKNASFQNGTSASGPFSPTRNGRSGGQRNSSYPSDNMPYSPGMNGYPVMPPTFPPYFGYPGPNAMPPQPYQDYQAHVSTLNGISHQLNYYFSFENLIKDMYLRAHMSSSGYVPLSFIAEFQRMKFLTQDLNMIRQVAVQSPDFIVRTDVEGQTHIRKRYEWEQFVLDMEARKPAAQHDGPTFADEAPPTPFVDQRQYHGPRNPAEAMFQPMHAPNAFQAFSPAAAGSPVNGFPRSPPVSMPVPGMDGQFDFNHPPQQPTLFLSEQAREASAPPSEPDDFEDETLDQLQVVVRPRAAPSDLSRVSSHGPTNGEHLNAPDGEEKAEEGPNGTHKRDHSARLADIKKTLTSPPSSHKSTLSSSSTTDTMLFVLKEKSEEPSALPPNSSYEPYGQICANAIHQRRNVAREDCPYEMRLLYDFWLHFLQRNFNTRMYTDFKVLAHEDFERGAKDGFQTLLKFYSESMLSSSRTIRAQVARDFVDLVAHEPHSGDRLAFKQMRQVLRNGALNLKSRRHIQDLASPELWTELDR